MLFFILSWLLKSFADKARPTQFVLCSVNVLVKIKIKNIEMSAFYVFYDLLLSSDKDLKYQIQLFFN